MRTTIAIDDDVLAGVRAIARQKNQPLGKIFSELALNSLQPPAATGERNGMPLLAVREAGVIVPMKSSTLSAPGTYVLAIAVAKGGQVATFDRRLSTKAVRRGRAGLHVIDAG